jgi:hypothetical protein
MEYKFLSPTSDFSAKYQSKRFGFLTLITVSVLLLTIASFLGVFGYRKYLEKKIDSLSASLEEIKSEIEPNFIVEITNFAERIKAGEEILSNHIAASSIFRFIEKNTLNKVSFSNFSFSIQKPSGRILKAKNIVSMNGVAENFSILAKQLDVLKNNPFIEQAEFSNFNLLPDGNINFLVKLTISQSLFVYNPAS